MLTSFESVRNRIKRRLFKKYLRKYLPSTKYFDHQVQVQVQVLSFSKCQVQVQVQVQYLLYLSTQVLKYVSTWTHPWFVLEEMCASGKVIIRFNRLLKTEIVQFRISRILLHLPLLGKVIRWYWTMQLAFLVSILHSAGLEILDSLLLSVHSIGNLYLRKQLDGVPRLVASGKSIHEALALSML